MIIMAFVQLFMPAIRAERRTVPISERKVTVNYE